MSEQQPEATEVVEDTTEHGNIEWSEDTEALPYEEPAATGGDDESSDEGDPAADAAPAEEPAPADEPVEVVEDEPAGEGEPA